MTPDPEHFALDVAAFAAKAKGLLREAVAETVQDLAEEIVTRTPYEFGLLRGSWYVTLNAPSEGPDGSKAGPGGTLVASLAAVLPGFKLGHTLYYLNNAKYAARLEYGFQGEDSLGRTYNQAGRAFVRGTLGEAQQIAERAAERVAAGGSGGAHKGGGGVRADVGWVQE